MIVKDVTEHEDGSATIVFDMDSDEVEKLLEYALVSLLCKSAVLNKTEEVKEETVEAINRR